eukprot:4408236-Amphidinium_carterae.1
MLVIKELGIDAKSCRGRDTPIVKWNIEKVEAVERSPRLTEDGDEVRQCRSIAMWITNLSQDRADLQVTVTELPSKMFKESDNTC